MNTMDTEQQSVRDVIGIFFLRKTTILAVFFGVVGAAFLVSFFLLSPAYESESTVLINTGQLVIPVTEGTSVSESEKLSSFHTQKDLITSNNIAALAVDQLHLSERRVIGRIEMIKLWFRENRREVGKSFGIDKWQKSEDYRYLAIRAVTSNLAVESKADSQVLKISYRANDPQEAADTLSTIIELYSNDFNDRVKSRAAGMTDYLEAQLHAAQEKVANTEREMLALKQADRVALRHPDATARRPDNPSANQAVARTVRDGRQTENSSLVGITDSASVQTELKVYVLSMEDELRKLRVQYTDNYPGVIELREKIARYTEALNDVPRRELELGRLKRDLDVAQDSLLFIRKNLERSRIVAAGNTDKINVISIVDPPRTNDDPISPNRLLIMVASVVFGFGFAVVLALVRNNLDHTLRSARDIQRELGLKSLGSLAKFEGQQP